MIEFVRRRAVKQAARRDEPRGVLQQLERVLSPDALTIGLRAALLPTNAPIFSWPTLKNSEHGQ